MIKIDQWEKKELLNSDYHMLCTYCVCHKQERAWEKWVPGRKESVKVAAACREPEDRIFVHVALSEHAWGLF